MNALRIKSRGIFIMRTKENVSMNKLTLWERRKSALLPKHHETDRLLRNLREVQLNYQRRHWAWWSILYPPAGKHIDKIFVNSKSSTKVVIHDRGYDYYYNTLLLMNTCHTFLKHSKEIKANLSQFLNDSWDIIF